MSEKKWFNTTIVVTAISLSFVVNTILVTNKYTRRSAEELQRINAITAQDVCEKRNGIWITGMGEEYCRDK